MYDELTEVDIQKMQDEIDYRTRELRPKLIEEVKTARGFGDLSENFEYKAAKQREKPQRQPHPLSAADDRTRRRSSIRPLVRPMRWACSTRWSSISRTTTRSRRSALVTTLRQNALEGLISKESPVGKAVMGHRAGETVHVQVNENVGYDIVIRSVEKGQDDDSLPISAY